MGAAYLGELIKLVFGYGVFVLIVLLLAYNQRKGVDEKFRHDNKADAKLQRGSNINRPASAPSHVPAFVWLGLIFAPPLALSVVTAIGTVNATRNKRENDAVWAEAKTIYPRYCDKAPVIELSRNATLRLPDVLVIDETRKSSESSRYPRFLGATSYVKFEGSPFTRSAERIPIRGNDSLCKGEDRESWDCRDPKFAYRVLTPSIKEEFLTEVPRYRVIYKEPTATTNKLISEQVVELRDGDDLLAKSTMHHMNGRSNCPDERWLVQALVQTVFDQGPELSAAPTAN